MDNTLNYKVLESEINWIAGIIDHKLLLLENSGTANIPLDTQAPEHTDVSVPYSNFVINNSLSIADRILVGLSLMPVVKPQLPDKLLVGDINLGKRISETGGKMGVNHLGLIPTLESFLFIVSNGTVSDRLSYMADYNNGHNIFKNKWLCLDDPLPHEPPQAGIVYPSQELLEILVHGKTYIPALSSDFPAKKITTKQNWEDLVLEENILKQIDEIMAWLEHGHVIYNNPGLSSKIKPGHRCLFYGPPGTGKTLTATLIGKYTGLDIYRIDLSMIVSKYIGETEKNLAKVFDRAENNNWILFFDEADALFGKRTNVKDAHDRYANQEVSYLLQRVEDYNGLVILATNFKSNIDDAFARRFQTIINFPMPKAEQREKLWTNMFTESGITVADNVNFKEISTRYEISGGAIINVIKYAILMSLRRGTRIVIADDIIEGIKKEYSKEGKAIRY